MKTIIAYASILAVWLSGIFIGVGVETALTTGITEPVADVILSASVPGIVKTWKFNEGDFVSSNVVILELDDRMEELEGERRKAAMDNSKSQLDALRTLAGKSSISVKKEDLERAETDYSIARTEHEMAVEQFRKRRVTSPCDGYIVEIARDVGEACQAYQPLIRVVDTRRCYFVSNVEAKLAGQLKLGQAVKLEIETPTEPARVSGKITYLAPVVDPASGLQKVKVLFDNTDGRIRPGVAGKLLFENHP